MTKRILSGFLALFLLFSMMACQSATPQGGTGTNGGDGTGTPDTGEIILPPRVTPSYTYELLDENKQYHYYEIKASYDDTVYPFLIRVPIVEDYFSDPDAAAERMQGTIDTLNAMAASSADVNMWLYVVPGIEDSEMMLDIIPTEYKGDNLAYFEEQLSDDIWLGTIKFRDIIEYEELFFETDHHWSAEGAYYAYQQLINGMAEIYPDMAPREGELVVTEASYYGSNGRELNFSGDYKDVFKFYDFGLPEHETVILKVNNRKKKDPKGSRLYASNVPFEENIAQYLDGSYRKSDTYDHYVNFYPICDTVTYPENQTGRNMLFIGDSFSLGLQELIASHFDNSYFFYADGTKDTFTGQDFTAFCTENGITDVVILEQAPRILYDFYDYSGPALASFYVSE